MSLQKSMDEKVNIEILKANQVKPKSNPFVDVPEWKRIRTLRAVHSGDVADNIGWKVEIVDFWETQM